MTEIPSSSTQSGETGTGSYSLLFIFVQIYTEYVRHDFKLLFAGEPGRITITTTVTIAIGITAIVLITLMIVLIAVTCRFAVCSRKNQGNRNAPYELTSNTALYRIWNDEASGDNTSPTAENDYIIINHGSAPAGPRGNNHYIP